MAQYQRQYNPQFLFLQHDPACPPQLGAKVLQTRNIDFQVIYTEYPNAFSYIHPKMFKGIVVLGGNQSAYDDDLYPWLKDCKLFLLKALDLNVPILGSCLGAQILANIIGSHNYKGQKGPEYGYYDITWTKHSINDPLCEYIKSNKLHKTFIYSHWDTFRFPKSSYYTTSNNVQLPIKLLASTAKYISMFKVGELSYGIQAHPEANYQVHDIWLDQGRDIINNLSCTSSGYKNVGTMRNDAKKIMKLQDENGCKFHNKWFDLCLEKAQKESNGIVNDDNTSNTQTSTNNTNNSNDKNNDANDYNDNNTNDDNVTNDNNDNNDNIINTINDNDK